MKSPFAAKIIIPRTTLSLTDGVTAAPPEEWDGISGQFSYCGLTTDTLNNSEFLRRFVCNCPTVRGSEAQRLRGSEAQRLRGSEAQRLRGSEENYQNISLIPNNFLNSTDTIIVDLMLDEERQIIENAIYSKDQNFCTTLLLMNDVISQVTLENGLEFPVNTFTAGTQTVPDIAVNCNDGLFVAVRQSFGQDGNRVEFIPGVLIRMENPQRVRLKVNKTTGGSQSVPSAGIYSSADGSFFYCMGVRWNEVTRMFTKAGMDNREN